MGGKAAVFSEVGDKLISVQISYRRGNIRDAHLGRQQFNGLFHADGRQVFDKTHAGFLLEQAAEIGTVEVHCVCDLFPGETVRVMCADIFFCVLNHGLVCVLNGGWLFGSRRARLFPGKLLCNRIQIMGELLMVDRLEQIVSHAEGAGLLGVGKFRITADHQNVGIRKKRPDMAEHFQSVHMGHADVRDNDVNGGYTQIVQGLRRTGEGCGNVKVRLILCDVLFQRGSHILLVIYDYQRKH